MVTISLTDEQMEKLETLRLDDDEAFAIAGQPFISGHHKAGTAEFAVYNKAEYDVIAQALREANKMKKARGATK